MIYDYQIIKDALTDNVENFNSIGYNNIDDIFSIETDYGTFEMNESGNYFFDLYELFYNNDTGNEMDLKIMLTETTLADCINHLNKLYDEYLEDQEQLELEKDL